MTEYMSDEESGAYVRQGRTCFNILAAGPDHWGEIPDATIQPENIDRYAVPAIFEHTFAEASYIDTLRRFGHDAVDRFADTLADWAGGVGERPDLLKSVDQRLEEARAKEAGK